MGSQTVISVENLSKAYRIKHKTQRQPYVSLRDVLVDRFRTAFRSRRQGIDWATGEETFWALRQVSFELNQGDVVGIIGRNGAGKSTLLKILSRITDPTEGKVRIKGRVASLLEVGTGFHPELTGRENIFLNGAILGMKQSEIRKRFDEIVAFAEVRKFLDTPVKHYSSGMYVRLAFAVAAHLDSEILIIDEVLAVGDATFQKRCLGKIHDVSTSGRTVIFVSHNMSAVKSLTDRGILLNRGMLIFDGRTAAAINTYSASEIQSSTSHENWGHGTHTTIRAVRLLDEHEKHVLQYWPGKPLLIEVELLTDGTPGMSLELFLSDASRVRIGMASLSQFHDLTLPSEQGLYRCLFKFEPLWLASGSYAIEASTSIANVTWDHVVETALNFEVHFSNPLECKFDFRQSLGYGPLALLPTETPTFSPASSEQNPCSIDLHKCTF